MWSTENKGEHSTQIEGEQWETLKDSNGRVTPSIFIFKDQSGYSLKNESDEAKKKMVTRTRFLAVGKSGILRNSINWRRKVKSMNTEVMKYRGH